MFCLSIKDLVGTQVLYETVLGRGQESLHMGRAFSLACRETQCVNNLLYNVSRKGAGILANAACFSL